MCNSFTKGNNDFLIICNSLTKEIFLKLLHILNIFRTKVTFHSSIDIVEWKFVKLYSNLLVFMTNDTSQDFDETYLL